ncbi:TIGR02678 family protein [Camelliibacillus cellulosilyticus]|uniref:TIGR02678 family protein n=1 Tax=Camelliibacillus cellulosilyticus TaxID=2174486 RepID=A0ABV9GTE9_9BACL
MEQGQAFDEKAAQGMDLLFHHYWILREEHPEWYHLIREREKVLRQYISDKFGLRLIIHQYFIKLEKIPVEPEAWMGIQVFQEPMDYAIFCSALSFLEGKAVDEQFLLSELCQDIQSDYPGDFPLDWTLFSHRKSLIRAIKVLMDFRLIRTVDGDISRFDHDETHEVLYEATTYSRYFMRTYPEDFSTYQHWNDLLKDDWKLNQEDERRKRVYRKLFFSPGMQRAGGQDPDFMYVRQYRNRLSEDIEKHSDYKLHVYKNTAFLSIDSPRQFHNVYPDTKAVTDILMQLSYYLHQQTERFPPNESGEILLTEGEFEQIIETLKGAYGSGWSKAFRDMSVSMIRTELIQAMKDWVMAAIDEETALIRIRPLLGAIAGSYPEDYQEGGEEA